MRLRLPLLLVGVGLLGGAAGFAWWRSRPVVEPPTAERTFEEIPKDEYEAWMQELGYTE